jgi:hypothetical protein
MNDGTGKMTWVLEHRGARPGHQHPGTLHPLPARLQLGA